MNGSNTTHIINCDKGIEFRNKRVSATITNVSIQDTETGIDIVNPFNSNISIQNCRINNCQIGIISKASNSSNISITDNNILLAPFGQTPFAGINSGISLIKLRNSSFVFYRVNCNTILTNRNSRGINLSGQQSTCDVSGNKIYHNEPPSSSSNSWGIYAVNCNGSNIYNNLITSYDNTLTTARNGVLLANNSRLNVNCNTLNRNFTGFRLLFDNPDLRLNGNTLQTHCLGIDASPQTIGYNFYSNSTGSDNRYNGPFINVGSIPARHAKNGVQLPINIIHSQETPPPNILEGNVSATINQLFNAYNCATYQCKTISQFISHPDTLVNIDSTEYYIVEQCISNWEEWYQNALSRELNKFIYENILKAPEVYLVVPEFAELFDNIQQTELPNLYWAYDELLNMTDTLGNSLTDSLYLERLHSIQIMLSQLSCNSLAAINERIVYTIYSNTLAEGIDSLSEEYRLILEDIAFQCPVSGGSAVYDAIALMNTFYPELLYNVVENCANNGFRLDDEIYGEVMLSDEINSETFNVYPNPTDGNIIVVNYSSASVLFNLYDITHRLIISKNIQGNNTMYISELAKLPDGIYIYQLIGVKNEKGKLIKSK